MAPRPLAPTARSLTAVMAVALLLTACAPDGEPSTIASPTGSLSPSATPTPTPTPTPSGSTGAYPDEIPDGTFGGGPLPDAQTWTIGFGTYGPLTVGGSYSAARAGLDEFSLAEPGGCSTIVTAVSGGTKVDVRLGDDDLVDAIVFGYGLGVVSKQLPATAAGISIGSTKKELLSAYPGIVGRAAAGNLTSYSTTDGAGRYLHFVVSPDWGDLVTMVQTSSSADVPLDICA